MATKKSERIGVIVILVVLLVGALGSYVAMALSVDNQSKEQSDYLAQYQQYLDQQKEEADKSEALPNYSARTFDASKVKSLTIEVLSAGNGETVNETDTINISYFGWMSDGKIFDSTKKLNNDDTPISRSLIGFIKGWTAGIAGQKVGSIVRLTIPSDQAYGSSGSGIIPADAPLEFIVEIHSATPATNA